MDPKGDASYTDQKGRTRWQRNDEIADKLRQLHDILVIGGYEASHAARYSRLAYTISRHPESVEALHREGCLVTISGVGETIAEIIGEFIETGTCTKLEEFAEHTPKTVLELTALPGLGIKTVKALYDELGIDSRASLSQALAEGKLEGVRLMNKKTQERIRQHISEISNDRGAFLSVR